MGNPLMQPGQMPPMQQQPQGPQVDPTNPDHIEQLQQAHQHLGIVTKTILGLIGKPKGQLTKKDVQRGAADMIAEGAFPESSGRQQLIMDMAKLPDDEAALRQYLGQHLMGFASAQQAIAAHLPPPGAPSDAG
jgi:hypothetical protein